jgi:hypothetical protein
MIFGADARRHAAVCSRLAEECEDKHLAERLRDMASNLLAKADVKNYQAKDDVRVDGVLRREHRHSSRVGQRNYISPSPGFKSEVGMQPASFGRNGSLLTSSQSTGVFAPVSNAPPPPGPTYAMNDMNDNAANPVTSVKPIILSAARMFLSHVQNMS